MEDGTPHLLHVLEVASLLRSSLPDHVIAAAVLHAVLEDTDAQSTELELRFGRAISELVVVALRARGAGSAASRPGLGLEPGGSSD